MILCLRQILNRCKDIKSVVFCYGSKILNPVSVQKIPVHGDRTIGNGLGCIGDDEFRIKIHLKPKSFAFLTGTKRAVE